MTGQELKAITLDERERHLCHLCKCRWCPKYDCTLLDRAKALTDRQWNNIAKNIRGEFGICDVPYEIIKRRPKPVIHSRRTAGKQHRLDTKR